MNVKDVISAVVDRMRPTFTGLTIVSNAGSPYNITGFTSTRLLFVGEKIRVIGTNPAVSALCTITQITDDTSIIISTSSVMTLGKYNNSLCTAAPILVFDHGHPLEVVERIKYYSEDVTLKFEAFPRICLFHDFEEKVTFEKQVSLNIVVVMNTEPQYTATERYTHTFDPVITPLYDLFIGMLPDSDNIVSTGDDYFKHSKFDRLYWGKNGLYGNTGNIFNDYVDAIEIENLELVITNC